MKIEGLNILPNDVELLDKMYMGEIECDDDDNFVPAVTSQQQRIIKELSRLFTLYNRAGNTFATTSRKLSFDKDNYVIMERGMMFHCIQTKNQDSILERLASIKQYGLLACEWFGIRYRINEVPYRVSFHYIPEKTLIKEVVINEGTKQEKTFPKLSDIALIVDSTNPALKELIKPSFISDSDEYFKRASETDVRRKDCAVNKAMAYIEYLKKIISPLFEEYSFPISIQENFKLKNALNKLVEIYTNHGLDKYIKDDKLENINQNLEFYLKELHLPTQEELKELEERLYHKKYNDELEFLQKCNNRLDRTEKYVYAGVPSSFIIGITLPKHLCDNSELIREISKIFPETPIISCMGEKLNSKIIEDELD